MEDNIICLDTNIWVKLFSPEERSDKVASLFEDWKSEEMTFIAPSFLLFELSSVLRKKEKMLLTHKGHAAEAVKLLYEYPIVLYQSEDFMRMSLSLAQKMDETVIYDVAFLALARWKKAAFYTSDLKFFNKANKFYSQIFYI